MKPTRPLRHLALALVLAGTPRAPAAEPMAGYLMGYFTESPKGRGDSWSLHLATSEDGLDWMPLNQNQPVLVSRLGEKGIRDPFFLRKTNGGFVMLATNLKGKTPVATPDIFVCDTGDFITFENPRLVRLHDTPMHTFAPEAFFDPARNEYGIIWSGDTDRQRIYINYTGDFLNVSPYEVYFDPGKDVRDATVVSTTVPGGHFLYYLDVSENRLLGSRSPSLASGGFDTQPYANPRGPIITEAPLLVKAPRENRWFLYGHTNKPENGEFHVWQTDDITADSWQEMGKRDYNPPLNAKHATVIPVTRVEMDRLVARWGRPKWNRLKPWNFPDCLVRHEAFLGRISFYPFDPNRDSQWILAPGLADPAGVSFEAANYPGYYLRTVAEHVMLSKNDGSAAFKTRSTFLKVPGLADPSGWSFRSFSSPDLYLRHAHFYLRVEAIDHAIDREDATFRIVY